MGKTLENLANEINSLLPNIKSRTLRFFGFWFGRPYDNIHEIKKAEARNDVLRLEFNEAETLEILNPMYCEFSSNHFEIRRAQKVMWKWYSYGRPKTDENLYYYDFEVVGTEIRVTTNTSCDECHLVAQITEPAVKIY